MIRPTHRDAWIWIDLDSQHLRGNALGDPTRRRFAVYLPPQYHAEPARRFPLALYLAGFGGWGSTKLIEEKAWETPLWARLDAAMGSGTIAPAIVAFPDAFTRFGGSQYVDSPVGGAHATCLCDEVVPRIDATLRTRKGRDHRLVMGKSSGGYGALHLAMTRPDVFGLCAATAADSLFELSLYPDFGKAIQAFDAAGGVLAFARGFFAGAPRHRHWMPALLAIACAQAWSPNLAVPEIFADLPFDPHTGELVSEVWARWTARDPVRACAGHADALRSLRMLFLDAGRSDEWSLQCGHRALSRRLSDLGVAHVHEEFDGGHLGIDHRIDVALQRAHEVWADDPP